MPADPNRDFIPKDVALAMLVLAGDFSSDTKTRAASVFLTYLNGLKHD